jgi:hypothetical protein
MAGKRPDLERNMATVSKVKNPPERQGGPGDPPKAMTRTVKSLEPTGPTSSDSTAIFMRDKYKATHPSWKAIADSAQKKFNMDPSKVDLPARVLAGQRGSGRTMMELSADRTKGMRKYGIKDSDFEK